MIQEMAKLNRQDVARAAAMWKEKAVLAHINQGRANEFAVEAAAGHSHGNSRRSL